MDLLSIAGGAMSVLTPYLNIFAKKSVEAFGKNVPAAADQLFQYLKHKLTSHPSGSEALQDLLEAPEDADRQATIRRQLVKLMEKDPSIAETVSRMIRTQPEIFDVTNAATTGDNAKVAQSVGHGNIINIK
jgi:hypothetical protein